MGSSRSPGRRRYPSNIVRLQRRWKNKNDLHRVYNRRTERSACFWCITLLLVVVVAVIICAPYLVLGPHVVISVDISRRQGPGTTVGAAPSASPSKVGASSAAPRNIDKNVGRNILQPKLGILDQLFSRIGAMHSQSTDAPPKHEPLSGAAAVNQPPPEGVVVAERATGLDQRGEDYGGIQEQSDSLPPVGMRDLCLGTAVGVTDVQLVTFAASFREVAPTADLVLFVDGRDDGGGRRNDIIQKYGIVALKLHTDELIPDVLRRYHPSSCRWVFAQRFLDARGSDYARVIMVDVGDTLFQANPYDIVGDPGLYAFVGEQSLGQSPLISAVINDCLGGPSVVSQMSELPNTFSGVTIATIAQATTYAREMSTALLSAAFQKCERGGVDQGLHNYLLHSGVVGDVLRFDLTSGPLVDMQFGKYKLSGQRVENLDGREVPIVRSVGLADSAASKIMESVSKRFVYWEEDRPPQHTLSIITNPEPSQVSNPALRGARDKASPPVAGGTDTGGVEKGSVNPGPCRKYNVREGVDMFKGVCDLDSVGAHGLDECCGACERVAACQAFSFDTGAGLCYTKNCNRPTHFGTNIRGVVSGFKSS